MGERPRWWRRHLRALAIATAALLAALAAIALVSWHFASFVLVPDHSPWSQDVTIEALSAHQIVLDRSEETERPGTYGLVWQAGHAVVGPIVRKDDETVTRRLSDVRGYLAVGTQAGLDSNVYSGDPAEALGLPFEPVEIAGELGPLPAWRIPAAPQDGNQRAVLGQQPEPKGSDAWVIVVHGINDNRQVGLRVARTLHRTGFESLLISYRDDLGAPSSPDGMHHQGQTEWRDLEAAVRYALHHGAKTLVLDGYSMGGALIAQFMERSTLAHRIDGLVLDAPALDWRSILEFNAERMGLPGFAALPVEWAIGARIDIDWDSLDALEHPEDFHLPILLFHGDDDAVVPIATSEDFAEELPDWVTYYAVPRAGHTQSWNVDPALYNRRLRRFLLQINAKTDRARSRGSGSKS